MDITIHLLVLVTFLSAAFLKGITGLGFSTMCLPVLTVFIDHKIAIPLVILPSLCSNVLVMVNAGKFAAAFKRFWPVYLAAIPGLLGGLWLLNALQSSKSRAILGIVLCVYAAWALIQSDFRLTGSLERWLGVPVGFVTGFVNGISGSQVMPILPYLLSLHLDKKLFVTSINLSFTLSSLIMLVGLRRIGLLNSQIILIAISGIIPVALGIYLGGLIRQSISEKHYRTIVLVFLFVLGISLIVKA
jgi:uncharacterized membrane protein YfcA